jgi:hypothetical protein
MGRKRIYREDECHRCRGPLDTEKRNARSYCKACWREYCQEHYRKYTRDQRRAQRPATQRDPADRRRRIPVNEPTNIVRDPQTGLGILPKFLNEQL